VSRRPNWLLRAPAQITIWLLLLFVALGPQHSLFVCTTGECCSAPASDVDCGPEVRCACCRAAAADAGKGHGPRVRPLRSHDCCIDLALLTEVGPLPTPVDCPDLSPQVVAQAPELGPGDAGRGGEPPPLHCTGPPRSDPRTALLATTILRL
jgi:hypothetical protein